MQDRPDEERKIGKMRSWLIKVGLVSPPKAEAGRQQSLTREQRKARQDLIWHMLRPPQK